MRQLKASTVDCLKSPRSRSRGSRCLRDKMNDEILYMRICFNLIIRAARRRRLISINRFS
jgi:hypothetical protein